MRRRTFLHALAAGISSPLAVHAAASDRRRVAVFGDSLSDGLCEALNARKRSTSVSFVRLGKISSGLVKPGFYDWPAAAARIGQDGYDAAVCLMGLNDLQGMADGGRHLAPDTDAWAEAYGRRVDEVSHGIQAAGTRLAWVGLPPVRDAAFNRTVQTINEVLADRVPADGGMFVDIWDESGSPPGHFSAYLPNGRGGQYGARQEDGMHFTGEGYQMVARTVLDAMEADGRFKDAVGS